MSITDLPAIGQLLNGGTFAGLTTKPDGTHCAVVLLPGTGTDLTWTKAKTWAEEQGGELPSRPVAALLFANVKASLQPRWHWSCEEHETEASCAWYCDFDNGYQYGATRSTKARLLPSATSRLGAANEHHPAACAALEDRPMSDIVERLRARQVTNWVHATGQTPRASGKRTDPLCAAAADEIERLRLVLEGEAQWDFEYLKECWRVSDQQVIERALRLAAAQQD